MTTVRQQIANAIARTRRHAEAEQISRDIVAEMRQPSSDTIERLRRDMPAASEARIRDALWRMADVMEGR